MAGNKPSNALLTGSMAGVAVSATVELQRGDWNFALWGVFVGGGQPERSFDGGTTWIPIAKDTSGAAANYTSPAALVGSEPEAGVLYRFNCTAWTSGTLFYRISQ